MATKREKARLAAEVDKLAAPKHSPLPWTTGQHMKHYVRGADGNDLALNLTPGNAALIVRAVNAHDALVEIAELVATGQFDRAVIRSKAALKLAKEGS